MVSVPFGDVKEAPSAFARYPLRPKCIFKQVPPPWMAEDIPAR